jgi:hypothetical protein
MHVILPSEGKAMTSVDNSDDDIKCTSTENDVGATISEHWCRFGCPKFADIGCNSCC